MQLQKNCNKSYYFNCPKIYHQKMVLLHFNSYFKAGLFVIFSTYFLRLLISSGTQPILLLIKHAWPSIISAAEKLPIKYSFLQALHQQEPMILSAIFVLVLMQFHLSFRRKKNCLNNNSIYRRHYHTFAIMKPL